MPSAVVALDETLLDTGFIRLDGGRFTKRVHGGAVLVTLLDGGARVRVNARLDDGSFLLSQSFTQGDSFQAVEAAMNRSLDLILAHREV